MQNIIEFKSDVNSLSKTIGKAKNDINYKYRNLSLLNLKTTVGCVSARESILITQIFYKWVKSGGKEFFSSRSDLAEYVGCHPQYITDMLKKYDQLFYRRYVHTGWGENRRTHMHIDVNILECCILFGKHIYTLVSGRLLNFLKKKTECIFSALAQVFHLPKKPKVDVLNTNNEEDVPMSEMKSPYDSTIRFKSDVVEWESDMDIVENEIEMRALAPALCDERASAISSSWVTRNMKVELKNNKPYAHVLLALKNKDAPQNTLERFKNKVSDNPPIVSVEVPAGEVHPLVQLLRKKLRPY